MELGLRVLPFGTDFRLRVLDPAFSLQSVGDFAA